MGAYKIVNGRIVTPDRIIEKGTVHIEHGIITEIASGAPAQVNANDIDAGGQWVLPGLIDSHSDAIEEEIQPRPQVLMPIDTAFRELERKIAAQGITTIYHSLGLNNVGKKRHVRSRETVTQVITSIKRLSAERKLVDHKIHLRFEITCTDMSDLVEQIVADRAVQQLSFTDHTPGQGQYRNMETYQKDVLTNESMSEQEKAQFVQDQTRKEKADDRHLQRIADLAKQYDIPIASHDDDSVDKLDWMQRLHATISEFPIELSVAKEAKKREMAVVMGANNVLRGVSQAGNLSALDAIREGTVDMLCSDYYPPSLLLAVFKLYQNGFDLPYAVNMVSRNPAEALGIAGQKGSIQIGKQADLLLVNVWNAHPLISRTIVGGNVVCGMEYV